MACQRSKADGIGDTPTGVCVCVCVGGCGLVSGWCGRGGRGESGVCVWGGGGMQVGFG